MDKYFVIPEQSESFSSFSEALKAVNPGETLIVVKHIAIVTKHEEVQP
jgi:hypothetical protein